MVYRFVRERPDYTDFSAGRVLYSIPGYPAFPVRLADEVFQRCVALLPPAVSARKLTLYDPCCGSAYLLTTLAFLHGSCLRRVVGSDPDAETLALGARNLSLLTKEGMEKRIAAITNMYAQYGKVSHVDALGSARRLLTRLTVTEQTHVIATAFFRADATDGYALQAHLGGNEVDFVVTDVPYGNQTTWFAPGDGYATHDPLRSLLGALLPVLAPHAVVAVVSDKRQRPTHEQYIRREQFQIGKRRVVVFTKA